MVASLALHNEAFELSKSLTADDAKLFARAVRGEDQDGNFIVRFLTDGTEDWPYFEKLASAYEFAEKHFQGGVL